MDMASQLANPSPEDRSEQDSRDSHSFGIEDYELGRPNRRDQASDPIEYQAGWNEAAAAEAYEADIAYEAGR